MRGGYRAPFDRPANYTLTFKQVREYTGYSRFFIDKWCKRTSDPLPHYVTWHGTVEIKYFDPKEVAAWLARQTS